MEATRHDEANGPQPQKIRAGQIELQLVDSGQGMPIVLVHGFPLDHTMWSAQLGTLSERWRVVVPDLRGFGGSQTVPGTATMEQMADDLVALLDALGIRERVVLVGLSMGGYVASQFWQKYAARLRALVLCDTRATADTAEAAEGRHKLAARVLAEGTQVVADAMMPKLFAPATAAGKPQIIEATRRTILANSPEGVAAAARGMAARLDSSGFLSQIMLPTLVIVGEHDAISTVDEMRGIARSIAGCEFVVIPRAGHMTPLENPAAFNEAIEQFLTRVERGGAAI